MPFVKSFQYIIWSYLDFIAASAQLGGFAFAEEGGAEADLGAAFLDGDFVVAAHAHGELGELEAGFFFDGVAAFAQSGEDGAGAFGFVAVGGHGHEAVDFEPGEGVDGFGDAGGVERLDAVFGAFAGDVDLEEDGKGFADFVGATIDFLGELEGVDGVEAVEEVDGFADFIFLQMTDQVPARAGTEAVDFQSGLLHFAFTEFAEAKFERLGKRI